MNEEISKYSDMILLERKVREETQNILFKMIEDMEGNLLKEINLEKKEREENEENFLNLLENTCSRME